jgi:glycine/D-amino acid oxidase-like deaminating enzyme
MPTLAGILDRDLERLAPVVGTRRSWWLREALAADPGPPCPPLVGEATTDVAIVGGGFTGLWTAWQLIEQSPGIRVTIIEQDIVGGGPSGRNGGFLTGWWDSLPALVRHFGEEDGVAAALECERAPGDVAAWCERQGVDAWLRPKGSLLASTSVAQDGAFDGSVEVATRLGFGDRFRAVPAEEMQALGGSPRLRAGYLVPGDANIQPARLARGLRRVLLERGVTIHESTRLRRLRPGGAGQAVVLETEVVAPGVADSMEAGADPARAHAAPAPGARGRVGAPGTLTADRVVLALNAWAASWRRFGSRLVTWSSYIVLTEPIPDRLAEIGYTSGHAISDGRFTNHYWQATPDGRIAFGGGGGRAGYGGRLGDWVTHDLGSVRLAARGFRRLYPQLADVALEDAWGGPIDIAPDHLPTFGTLPPGTVHYGHGYSGTGVGPSHLGGRILAALALGRTDDPVARLPLVEHRPRRFPPEPFRFLGARVIREAIVAKEQRDDLGRPSPRLLRALVRLPRTMGYDLGPE